ncbi:MAG: transposase [Bacteroidota bacterium]
MEEDFCCFDTLYNEVLIPQFSQIEDKRRVNSSYSQLESLKSGFALYSLKSPSLYAFHQRTDAESSNLKQVFKLNQVPSDNGLRKILDQVDSDALRKSFKALYDWADDKKALDAFNIWRGHRILSIDGVEHFKSKSISCPHCLHRNHRDGTQSHYHCMLSAALVKPGLKEVLIVDNEPIINQDGAVKNDCERNASKRLLANLTQAYGHQDMILTMDALYACAPIISQIQQQKNWHYLISVTETGHKALFNQFDQLEEQGAIQWVTHKDKKEQFALGYANGLYLNDSAKDIKCNMLYCIWRNSKGKEVVFSWITDLPLNERTVVQFMRIARSRWKIENEVFNTLKNQNYQFEHNFGHGHQNLCTNFAYLMMLAFCVDQLQQLACTVFQQILTVVKTKVKFWELVRSVFRIIPCYSMRDIHYKIADLHYIQIE